VQPSPTSPAETPSTTTGPTIPSSDAFAADTVVNVVVSDLRVRTAPPVDNAKSAKLDPLLGRGTQLRVIDGPVTADGYDWYLVQAIGLPHRGWIAAADHDGAPWVEDEARTASGAPGFSAAEAALLAGLRSDAAVDCVPRRTHLPTLAIAGIECRVATALVSRIGAYRFRDAQDAATTYLQRLASYGVAPATGGCLAGTSGESAWQPGDGATAIASASVQFGDLGPWSVGRSGCFLDENGVANARATCGSTYIGVLGRDVDLAAVQRWLWTSPDGPMATGEPPGICKAGA
jgi:hypothetical protein